MLPAAELLAAWGGVGGVCWNACKGCSPRGIALLLPLVLLLLLLLAAGRLPVSGRRRSSGVLLDAAAPFSWPRRLAAVLFVRGNRAGRLVTLLLLLLLLLGCVTGRSPVLLHVGLAVACACCCLATLLLCGRHFLHLCLHPARFVFACFVQMGRRCCGCGPPRVGACPARLLRSGLLGAGLLQLFVFESRRVGWVGRCFTFGGRPRALPASTKRRPLQRGP